MAVYRLGVVCMTYVVFIAGRGIADSTSSYVPSESNLEQDLSSNENNLTFPENSTHLNTDTESGMKYIFDSMRLMGFEVLQNKTEVSVSARMKMSDFMFNPMMFIPQLIMWGFAPILLANMKMFIMQALMLNKMALNAAIFMTLRNIVFGPRPGPVVKYANYGYGHDQNKVYHYHKS